jgi:intracellular septation protein A
MSLALAEPAASTASPAPSRMSFGLFVRIVRPLGVDLAGSLFFAGLYAATHDLILATGVGMVMGALPIGWRLWRREPVAALQWASLGLVLVMGGLAIAVRDPRIVMIKPSIIYAVIGLSMLQPGWMLRYAPAVREDVIPRRAYVIAGYGWAALLLVSAALNLYFALFTSPAAWALFIALYPLTAKIGAFATQFVAFGFVAAINKRRVRRAALAPAQAALA